MINIKRYTIDYVKYVTQRIPARIRFDEVIAYALVLVSPVVQLYNSLLLFRDLMLYKLTITPQVVYLEKMLNDRYDNIERRIYVTDGKEYSSIFVYTKSEGKPNFIFTKAETGVLQTFLYLKNETGQFTFDFVVHVPVLVDFDINEMTSLVNAYKLASKSFKIKIE
jgi:hypothetical protein